MRYIFGTVKHFRLNQPMETLTQKKSYLLITFDQHLLLFDFFVHLLDSFLSCRIGDISQCLLLVVFYFTSQLRSKKNIYIYITSYYNTLLHILHTEP